MKRLLDIGFKYAGNWSLIGNDLIISIDAHGDTNNILYVFMVNDEVKYIGKTIRSFKQRMYGYLKPGSTQTTNIKNNKNIKETLRVGKTVEIYVLPDEGHHCIGEFHLNIAAGLEDSLIKTLNPEWNGSSVKSKHSNKKMLKRTANGSKNNLTLRPSHTFFLRPTYLKQGFFNVPVASEKYYGEHGENIDIYCGKSKIVIKGHINRTVNKTNTPRIMGGIKLRNWFQELFKVNDLMEVNIIKPCQIRINKS